MQGIIGPDLKSRYEHVLKGFLNTPADRETGNETNLYPQHDDGAQWLYP